MEITRSYEDNNCIEGCSECNRALRTISVGNMVYTSGQLGINPATGKLEEGVEAQTHMSLKNLQAILAEKGMTLDDVVKTTVFVKNLDDFTVVNQIYGSYLLNIRQEAVYRWLSYLWTDLWK